MQMSRPMRMRKPTASSGLLASLVVSASLPAQKHSREVRAWERSIKQLLIVNKFDAEPKEPAKPRNDIVPNVYSLYDFIFPGGKLAKLVGVVHKAKIENPNLTDRQLLDIARAFKFVEGMPVVVMAGARETGRGKFLAGLSRAAFRSDAAIIDSGIETGIENYCLRRSIHH